MRMSIVDFEYNNIRKITSLKVPFTNSSGEVIKYSFIMMGNGTGKTTTLTLIRGLLDGSAAQWSPEDVKSYKPMNNAVKSGSFSMSVKFDNSLYKYILTLNYNTGVASIETVALPRGRENGRLLPEALHGIFTPNFVRRFVFDGEQAERTLDSSSNEAEEAIRYLYRLDILDEVLASNESILAESQNAESSIGTPASISNLTTRRNTAKEKMERLAVRANELREAIKDKKEALKKKEIKQGELYRNYDALNEEKNKIIS